MSKNSSPDSPPPDPSLWKKIGAIIGLTGIAAPTIDLIANALRSAPMPKQANPGEQNANQEPQIVASADPDYDEDALWGDYDRMTSTQEETETEEQNRCLSDNPDAMSCEEYSERLTSEPTEQASLQYTAKNFLSSRFSGYRNLGKCTWDDSFELGKVSACIGAGDTYHCPVEVQYRKDGPYIPEVLSLFVCLCCDEEGYLDGQFEHPHTSGGAKTGRRANRGRGEVKVRRVYPNKTRGL